MKWLDGLFKKILPRKTKTMETQTISSALPKALQRTYQENFQYFDEWMSNHRTFQNEAIEKLDAENLGSCFLPTGTGKTRVQVHL